MVDVSRWLAEQGLGHHAEAFAENGIAGDILRELTDADLRELGLNLGERKRLLKAIGALAAGSTDDQAEIAEPTAMPAVPREAERRQLTVLFCDLVGSTALAAQLDPEDTGRVIRAYQGCCTEVVERWGGQVAKFMGDGVLAYFGWPQAHEDDAERAVRAGLDLTDAIELLAAPSGQALAARVGIATGLVMVGELIGKGAAQEEAVVGETPNLAARLQALAAPGSVVISHATRRLVGGLFELADLGPQRLKGFAEPLAAWRVEGEGRAEGRFEAMHTTVLMPLVGREHELGLLLDRWELAKGSEGQVVLLAGEPGIGKSRLTQALLERIATEPHVRLRYYCSPYHTNSALHPVIEQLERAAGFVADDCAEVRLDKLEAVLRLSSAQVVEVAPLLAALLSIRSDGRYPSLNLTPQAQKTKTFEALLAQLKGLAAGQPVLMVFEDAHWIDPTSAELLGQVIDRVTRLPVLLVITFRPEFTLPWTGYAHVASLKLSRLGQRQGAAIIERLAGGKALPAEVLEEIVARTDGVPLFVEELTKTVLESGLLTDAGDHYELAGPLSTLAIPATLHDSLMARLDRLAPIKEVAQTAAVIGREFSHNLLAAVSLLSDSDLDAALDQFVTSELIFRRGTPPEATYSFKHALVQDAAYQSLLKSRRQQLHTRVAEAIEAGHVGEGRAPAEILAHHLTEAGLLARALPAWLAAGEHAWRRSAYQEAIVHLRRGLEVASNVPVSEGKRPGIRLHNLLGAALLAAHGPSPDAIEAYEDARRLAAEAGETGELLRALWGLWFCSSLRADIASAQSIAFDLLGRAGGTTDDGLELQAHHAAWTTGWLAGDLRGAREHAEAGLRLYDEARHHELTAYYGGHDAGVCCRNTLGVTLWLSGFPDRAAARVEEGVALARRLAHPFTLAITLAFASWVRLFRGEREEAERLSRELIELCAEQGIPVYLASGRILKGSLRAADDEDAVDVVLANIRALEGLGANARRSFHLGLLAEAHLRAGQPREGLAVLEEAQRFVAEKGERWYEPELHRLQGQLTLAAGGARDDAWLAFEASRAVAGERGARSLELRAAIRLARLDAEAGERQRARALLGPIYGWFTEGFETADLKEAKTLLDELT
jgi:class 3 adenylate cyclase/tetratricopeptide (TPR) repeat protein